MLLKKFNIDAKDHAEFVKIEEQIRVADLQDMEDAGSPKTTNYEYNISKDKDVNFSDVNKRKASLGFDDFASNLK